MKLLQNYSLLFILLFSSLVYVPFLFGYFQQDEWYAFGKLIFDSRLSIPHQIVNYFSFNRGHYVPLHHLVFFILFSLFKLHYFYWALFSLLWHLINVSLVFKVSKLLTKDKTVAVVTSIFFALSASTVQATTWVGANVNTHGATTFGLLSMYYFIEYFNKTKQKNLNLSLLFLFISLLFKEITIALFALYTIILLRQKKPWKSVFVSGFLYTIFRSVMVLHSSSAEEIVTESQSITQTMINALLYPIHVISQTVIPQEFYKDIGYYIASKLPWTFYLKGKTDYDLFVQNYILLLVSFLIVVTITVLVIRTRSKLLGVFLMFIILNSFIFVLSPERTGNIVLVDSRNLYFCNIGTSLLLAALVMKIHRLMLRRVVIVLIVVMNSFYLLTHVLDVRETGIIRQEIVTKLLDAYNGSQNTVYFATSDSTYYGLSPDEPILPFQSGLGHVLMVNVALQESLSPLFFAERFLWDITSQGYEIHEGRGFGYYRDKAQLQSAVDMYSIKPEEIIAFKWQSSLSSLQESKEIVSDIYDK